MILEDKDQEYRIRFYMIYKRLVINFFGAMESFFLAA